MALTDLVISYPDFKMAEIIDPEQFDTNNYDIVTKINAVIALLNALTDTSEGVSGADKLYATPIPGIDGVTVQQILQGLKNNDDTNFAYLQALIQGISLGGIPDGTITPEKLAFAVLVVDDLIKVRNDSTKPFMLETRTDDPANPEVGRMWLRVDL